MFPPTLPMYTIFNKNKAKIGYSYCPNMGSIISSHNKHILDSNNTEFRCNWSNRDKFPLENKCLTTRNAYRADVTNNRIDGHKYFYCISGTAFKERYENHKTSLRHRSHLTVLHRPKYYWKLVEIIRNLDDMNILKNKSSEVISKCWHMNRRLLNRVKNDSNDWLWCVFVFRVCFIVLLMKSFCSCR